MIPFQISFTGFYRCLFNPFQSPLTSNRICSMLQRGMSGCIQDTFLASFNICAIHLDYIDPAFTLHTKYPRSDSSFTSIPSFFNPNFLVYSLRLCKYPRLKHPKYINQWRRHLVYENNDLFDDFLCSNRDASHYCSLTPLASIPFHKGKVFHPPTNLTPTDNIHPDLVGISSRSFGSSNRNTSIPSSNRNHPLFSTIRRIITSNLTHAMSWLVCLCILFINPARNKLVFMDIFFDLWIVSRILDLSLPLFLGSREWVFGGHHSVSSCSNNTWTGRRSAAVITFSRCWRWRPEWRIILLKSKIKAHIYIVWIIKEI